MGPRSWHYVLNPPKYRMSVKRIPSRSFVKEVDENKVSLVKQLKEMR